MAIHAVTSHLLTALVSFGAGFGYYGSNKLDKLSSDVSSLVQSSEQKINNVSTEVLSVLELTQSGLKKVNRPLLQNVGEAVSTNISYLGQVEICGIEHAFIKLLFASAIACLGCYGYNKYQTTQDACKVNEYSQNEKDSKKL